MNLLVMLTTQTTLITIQTSWFWGKSSPDMEKRQFTALEKNIVGQIHSWGHSFDLNESFGCKILGLKFVLLLVCPFLFVGDDFVYLYFSFGGKKNTGPGLELFSA